MIMSKLYTKLYLKDKTTTMQCFVEHDPKLDVGDQITLKSSNDPDRWWEITSIGEPIEKGIAQKQKSERFFDKDYHGKLKGL